MGPNRQSLSNQRTGRTPRPCNLRVRLQGKANAKQKEIGNRRIIPEIPYLCRVFLPRIAHTVFDRRARETGCGFYRTCAHSYANRSRADQWHIAIIRFSSFCASISSHTDQPFDEYGNGFAFLNLRNDV